jgi:Zn-dependent protease with chaperone function
MRKLCVVISFLLLFFIGTGAVHPAKTQAGSLGLALDVLTAAAEYAYYMEQWKYVEFNMQDQMLKHYKAQSGVSRDDAANAMLYRIAVRLQSAPENREILERPPKYFINPNQNYNACRALGNIISINEGTFWELGFSEDMVAMVVSHEMAHGTKMHILKGLQPLIGADVLKRLYAKRADIEVSRLNAVDYLVNQIRSIGYSIPYEWEADNIGFNYMASAGYNPGAPAASFVRMQALYGPDRQGVFGKLFQPANHPPTDQRIENFSRRLTEYSGNTVSVSGVTVSVKGQVFLAAQPLGEMLAAQRAFLVAGNLARVFHQTPKPAEGATVDFSTVRLAGQAIITPGPDEPSAEDLRDKLNQILGFTAPAFAAPPAAPSPKAPSANWKAI